MAPPRNDDTYGGPSHVQPPQTPPIDRGAGPVQASGPGPVAPISRPDVATPPAAAPPAHFPDNHEPLATGGWGNGWTGANKSAAWKARHPGLFPVRQPPQEPGHVGPNDDHGFRAPPQEPGHVPTSGPRQFPPGPPPGLP